MIPDTVWPVNWSRPFFAGAYTASDKRPVKIAVWLRETSYVSCMLVWCDLHVACNVLCTAISRAVVYKHASFSKTLGTSHKIHACTLLASVKFKSSCTVCSVDIRTTFKNVTQTNLLLQHLDHGDHHYKCMIIYQLKSLIYLLYDQLKFVLHYHHIPSLFSTSYESLLNYQPLTNLIF